MKKVFEQHIFVNLSYASQSETVLIPSRIEVSIRIGSGP